jgi:TonB family protein
VKKDTVALKRKRAKKRDRLARLKKIKERLVRERRWRQQYAKRKETEQRKRTASATPPKDSPAGNKAVTDRPKSKVGYPGEGGGDGQGGGSRGAAAGGAARTELGRYYGLLTERVDNHFTVPPGLKKEFKNLKTIVVVDVGRDGSIRNLEIELSSGKSAYDKAALRAVKSAADPAFPPLPNTVKGKWIPIGFRFCGLNFCRS